MASISAAIIAAAATLITAFITQFLSERYRRFNEASAVAAGISGELSSYGEAVPLLRISLHTMSENIKLGRKDSVKFRSFEKPVDRFYDAVVGKLGMLGPELAERIIYIYGNLNAFRGVLVTIHEKHAEMEGPELLARLTLCQDAMERAFKAAEAVMPVLRARSSERFKVWSLK